MFIDQLPSTSPIHQKSVYFIRDKSEVGSHPALIISDDNDDFVTFLPITSAAQDGGIPFIFKNLDGKLCYSYLSVKQITTRRLQKIPETPIFAQEINGEFFDYIMKFIYNRFNKSFDADKEIADYSKTFFEKYKETIPTYHDYASHKYERKITSAVTRVAPQPSEVKEQVKQPAKSESKSLDEYIEMYRDKKISAKEAAAALYMSVSNFYYKVKAKYPTEKKEDNQPTLAQIEEIAAKVSTEIDAELEAKRKGIEIRTVDVPIAISSLTVSDRLTALRCEDWFKEYSSKTDFKDFIHKKIEKYSVEDMNVFLRVYCNYGVVVASKIYGIVKSACRVRYEQIIAFAKGN